MNIKTIPFEKNFRIIRAKKIPSKKGFLVLGTRGFDYVIGIFSKKEFNEASALFQELANLQNYEKY
jgi:hypothetical protein